METIESLAAELESLRDLGSIVRTMKSLAAVNIRQYEQAVTALRDYDATVRRGLQAALHGAPLLPETAPGEGADTGVLLFGSDHGLCGRFNEEIVEHLLSSERRFDRCLVVGARPAGALAAAGRPAGRELPVPSAPSQIGPLVQRLLGEVQDWREAGIGRVTVYHNRLAGPASYQSHRRELLPVDLSRLRGHPPPRWPSRSLPDHRQPRSQLLSGLVRQYFFVTLFGACAESLAAENASRLAAMQAAESNLAEKVDDTLMEYRRVRQDQITGELLDVVSGYETLARR